MDTTAPVETVNGHAHCSSNARATWKFTCVTRSTFARTVMTQEHTVTSHLHATGRAIAHALSDTSRRVNGEFFVHAGHVVFRFSGENEHFGVVLFCAHLQALHAQNAGLVGRKFHECRTPPFGQAHRYFMRNDGWIEREDRPRPEWLPEEPEWIPIAAL
ncbi:hypothetical protein [Gemmatimonas sp.]